MLDQTLIELSYPTQDDRDYQVILAGRRIRTLPEVSKVIYSRPISDQTTPPTRHYTLTIAYSGSDSILSRISSIFHRTTGLTGANCRFLGKKRILE